MDLFEFNSLIRENFNDIAALNNSDDEITSQNVIDFFKMDMKKAHHEFLIQNLDTLNCLISVENKENTFKLFPYEDQFDKNEILTNLLPENEKEDEKQNQLLEINSKNINEPINPDESSSLLSKYRLFKTDELLKIDVNILDTEEMKNDKSLYIYKTESFVCGCCKHFQETSNKCSFRYNIKVKEYYPACVFISFKRENFLENINR